MRNFERIATVFVFASAIFLVESCASPAPRTVAADERAGRSDLIVTSLPMNFSVSAQELATACDEALRAMKNKVDRIAAVPEKEARLENTLVALDTALGESSNSLSPLAFLKSVATSADVRKAGDDCETKTSKAMIDVFLREDLYKAIRGFAARKGSLEPEQERLLKETLESFHRNGLDLPGDKRREYTEKKKRLVELQALFSTRINDYKDSLLVTKKELAGLPASYVDGLKKVKGRYQVTLEYPDYFPFMQNAKNGKLRQELEFKFARVGGEANVKTLNEVLNLRREMAQLLGYPTHAHFVISKEMAKSPEAVLKFLDNLIEKLRPLGKQNLAELLKLKKKDEPKALNVQVWDWRYYDEVLRRTKYSFSTEKVREYFPLDVVMKGMFEIYSNLLSVKFEVVDKAAVWHPSVKLYRVVRGDKTVAQFYLDLFPREGKYKHAAKFGLIGAYRLTDGSYRSPVSAVVANFKSAGLNTPSLLDHAEVETLFHEFGHVMHESLTQARYASQSGTAVKQDFVEAPSQMLENWVWRPETLVKLSGHYKDPSKKLPPDLMDRLIKAKRLDEGIKYLRQAAYAKMDLTFHMQPAVDSTQVAFSVMKEIGLIPSQPGTIPQAGFDHIMNGYDAGYYGYLWSEVFAQDMFTRFDQEGLLNAKTGADYVHWILEPGGSKDPMTLITGFLGRESNQEAFLRSLGLTL